MKRINIFTPGRHTSASGATIDFTEDHLKAAVENYDPAIHEAPVVVGHPKDNHPAYGWIGSMEYSEENGLDALPLQVDESFEEMVSAGRFKKVSASWYTPDSPTNPKPGAYYLRHVGFLGAQPPAIKGLKPVELNEAEEGVVEFSAAWDTENTAGIFRRLREFIIDKFSKEEADSIIPDYAITDLENSARRQFDSDNDLDPAFNENTPPKDSDMDPKKLKDENDQLKQKLADAEAKNASFSEREDALKQQEAAARTTAITGYVDGAIEAGKLVPAQRDNMIAFMEKLDQNQIVEFGEGDKKAELQLMDAMKSIIDNGPAKVNFNEESGDDHRKVDLTPEEVAEKAQVFHKKQQDAGINISFTEAVTAVESGTAE